MAIEGEGRSRLARRIGTARHREACTTASRGISIPSPKTLQWGKPRPPAQGLAQARSPISRTLRKLVFLFFPFSSSRSKSNLHVHLHPLPSTTSCQPTTCSHQVSLVPFRLCTPSSITATAAIPHIGDAVPFVTYENMNGVLADIADIVWAPQPLGWAI